MKENHTIGAVAGNTLACDITVQATCNGMLINIMRLILMQLDLSHFRSFQNNSRFEMRKPRSVSSIGLFDSHDELFLYVLRCRLDIPAEYDGIHHPPCLDC